MSIACRLKLGRGQSYCATHCPAPDAFRYLRVERPEDAPRPDEKSVDVVILDMNHGWPNLGHDSLVIAVKEVACDMVEALAPTGLVVRAISYDVRRRGGVPKPQPGALYLGTGGPGAINPWDNDGVSAGSQGIKEDPSWEGPFKRLMETVLGDPTSALLAVCHTFGVLCRLSGAAAPVLRGPEKGGKSSGLLENLLTDEARRHPWFSKFAAELSDGRRHRIVDNRLFDLIPKTLAPPLIPLAREALIRGGEGDALTMLEFARDPGGVMPRVLGVNHHPEIVDRARQMLVLDDKLERGDVSREWYEERASALTRSYPDEDSDRRVHTTSDYTLLAPLRFHLNRRVRERAESLGYKIDVHEDRVFEEIHGVSGVLQAPRA